MNGKSAQQVCPCFVLMTQVWRFSWVTFLSREEQAWISSAQQALLAKGSFMTGGFWPIAATGASGRKLPVATANIGPLAVFIVNLALKQVLIKPHRNQLHAFNKIRVETIGWYKAGNDHL